VITILSNFDFFSENILTTVFKNQIAFVHKIPVF
jgi:hypothetical protein